MYDNELNSLESSSKNDIINIINTIDNNQKTIKKAIIYFLKKEQLYIPCEIDIHVSITGAYINLIYTNIDITLVFVCHSIKNDENTKSIYSNIMHCKVIQTSTKYLLGYSEVYIKNNIFMFKQPRDDYQYNKYFIVYKNIDYFFSIFNSINDLWGIKNGGGKNIKINFKDYTVLESIKINFKDYTVLELKNICKKYKIKNYSKLNRDDLVSLIKKNKNIFFTRT